MGLFGKTKTSGKKGGSLGNSDFIGEKLDSIYFPDSSEDEAKAAAARQKALDEILGVKNTKFNEYKPEEYDWLQDLTPAQIEELGPTEVERLSNSAMEDVSTDPRLKDQQLASLAALDELAGSGGMNAADQANLNRVQTGNATADRGRREAILQNMQSRGMGGSGMELLAQLDSSQAATDRSAQQGLDIAGMAQQRALDAMLQSGNLAGDVRGQDFGEGAQKAAAMDAIAKFNATNANQMSQFDANNALDVRKANANFQQDTNVYNNSGRQNVANSNVGVGNDAQKYGNSQIQNQFDNDMGLAGSRANAHTGQAQHYQGKADTTQAQAAGAREATINAVGNYATGGASGAAKTAAPKKKAAAPADDTPAFNTAEEDSEYGDGPYRTSDKRAKKDVKEVKGTDLDTFLKSLTKNKFKYKDESDGKGEHCGPMAQDLEKTEVGKTALVKGKSGKLAYDKDKMQGIMLAALSHLSDKIDEAS